MRDLFSGSQVVGFEGDDQEKTKDHRSMKSNQAPKTLNAPSKSHPLRSYTRTAYSLLQSTCHNYIPSVQVTRSHTVRYGYLILEKLPLSIIYHMLRIRNHCQQNPANRSTTLHSNSGCGSAVHILFAKIKD